MLNKFNGRCEIMIETIVFPKVMAIPPPEGVDSFYLPDYDQLTKIKRGNIVKVKFGQEGRTTERMWCIVNSVNDEGRVYASLDNTPFNLDIKYQDPVEFRLNDIIQIWKD